MLQTLIDQIAEWEYSYFIFPALLVVTFLTCVILCIIAEKRKTKKQ